MRCALIATGLLSAAAAATNFAFAGEPYLTTTIDAPIAASESGVPPPELRLRAIVARALDDSIATWKRLVATDALEVGNVNVRFVTHLAPSNCFGLYSGDGPAYCSGNATVFVGVDAANHLMSRFGSEGEAGITFLIGHEIGHHIQNIFGRFRYLDYVVRSSPGNRARILAPLRARGRLLCGRVDSGERRVGKIRPLPGGHAHGHCQHRRRQLARCERQARCRGGCARQLAAARALVRARPAKRQPAGVRYVLSRQSLSWPEPRTRCRGRC